MKTGINYSCSFLNRALIVLLFIILFIGVSSISAQINPLVSQYYQNQYLGNPALAGMDDNLNINLSYRNQWNGIPGAPVTQTLTGDYRVKKVGLGLSIYNDKAGLIKGTRTMATYAYHLPLNIKGDELHFGWSLGFMHEYINKEDIIGDQNDVAVEQFNLREMTIDGDFGIAYTNERLTIQGSLPNLKTYFKKDYNIGNIDRPTFYSAISYMFKSGVDRNEVALEPKFCYRGVKGAANMWDLGSSVMFANNLNMMCMYHSTKSASFSLGMNYMTSVYFQFIYTKEMSALTHDTKGIFEVNLKIPLLKPKE
ncbi:PorP/SprF family type IX secretion system membrane protein [Pedobacter sp. P351]|uniref:PorP/SprF family type IX secretion system membrane protein n=1 Tax=Pedobacter superstes TaxID=3133441 RepID=UPI00309D1682